MSAIGKGDVVQIVRWPCCGAGLGVVFTVQGVEHGAADEVIRCTACDAVHPTMHSLI